MVLFEMCDRNPVSFSTAVITWPVIADQIRSDCIFLLNSYYGKLNYRSDLERAWLSLLVLVLEISLHGLESFHLLR